MKKNSDKSIKADHPAKQPQHPAGIDSAGGWLTYTVWGGAGGPTTG